MFPADDSAAIPSPRQVAYASIEWLMCGLQALSSESAVAAESDTERVGVIQRVRKMAVAVAAAWVDQQQPLAAEVAQ